MSSEIVMMDMMDGYAWDKRCRVNALGFSPSKAIGAIDLPEELFSSRECKVVLCFYMIFLPWFLSSLDSWLVIIWAP